MKKYLTALFVFLFINTNLKAQAGLLDLSFDVDGVATLSPGTLHDVVYAVEVQPDQMIVFAGVGRITSTTGFTSDLVIGRLNTNGVRDSAFANNGIFNLASTGGSVFGYDVLIQPDGKIVACGGYSVTASNTDFIAVRLNTDGTPDTSFGGGDGISILSVGSGEDYAYDIELLPNGNFILAGTSSVPGFTYSSGIVMRLLPDGSVDNTFGTGGYTSIQSTSAAEETFKCMEIMPSGKIIAAGSSYTNNNDYVLMAAFSPNGDLDTTFANNGVHTGNSINVAFDLAINGNAIYLAGRITNSGGYDLGITCFDTTGVILSSFGQLGVVSANYNPIDCALGITIQPDGKLVCAGTSGLGTFNNRDFLVTRYLPNGSLDVTFAGTGYKIIPVGSSFDEANAVTLQADGKILAAGFASLGNNDMAFVRLTNDLAVGISPIQPSYDLNIYPIPLTGSILRITSSIQFDEAVVCQMFDLTGKQVVFNTIQSPGSNFELELPSLLPAGAYLLYIQSGKISISRLIMK